MNESELLIEIEDIIRTAPPIWSLHRSDPQTLDWIGRVEATFMDMPSALSIPMSLAISRLHGTSASESEKAETDVRRMLNAARWRYRQKTGGPTGLAVDAGMVFDYFNGVSKLLQTARGDVLVVDPYLDGEFVERFLPSIDVSVPVRLLGRERRTALKPAAEAFAVQYKRKIEVRSGPGFHDRFVLIDAARCFQSGASFKDGAKKTPTTLTEITDAFADVLKTYEAIWAAATVDYRSP